MDAAGTGGVRTEEILRQLLVAGSIDASTSVHVLRAKLSDLAVEGKVYTSACAVVVVVVVVDEGCRVGRLLSLPGRAAPRTHRSLSPSTDPLPPPPPPQQTTTIRG